jgi:hypothetical protein
MRVLLSTHPGARNQEPGARRTKNQEYLGPGRPEARKIGSQGNQEPGEPRKPGARGARKTRSRKDQEPNPRTRNRRVKEIVIG